MKKSLRFLLVMVALPAWATIANAQQVPDPRVADLVRAGKLRVALFPPEYSKDPVTGELRGGPFMEIARALAARLGIEALPVEYPTPPKVVECLGAGTCDVGFVGIDRAEKVGLGFSRPFMQLEFTYLVPAGSSIRSAADVDRTGVRIAAVRSHLSTVALTGILKHATLVYAETPDPTFDLLRTGHADAMASVRTALREYSPRLPGSRVLEDHYGANRMTMVVAKNQAGRLSYISEFIEEAKASGLVQRAIERDGSGGYQAISPGNPNAQK
jgi:polar amino acid transport system substrate-binding protein